MKIIYREVIFNVIKDYLQNGDSGARIDVGDRFLSFDDILWEVTRHTEFGEEFYRNMESAYDEGARL